MKKVYITLVNGQTEIFDGKEAVDTVVRQIALHTGIGDPLPVIAFKEETGIRYIIWDKVAYIKTMH